MPHDQRDACLLRMHHILESLLQAQFHGSYVTCNSLLVLSFPMASTDRWLPFSVTCRSCRYNACSGLHNARPQSVFLIAPGCLDSVSILTRPAWTKRFQTCVSMHTTNHRSKFGSPDGRSLVTVLLLWKTLHFLLHVMFICL